MRWERVYSRSTPGALRWGNALSWSSWGGTLRCAAFGAVMVCCEVYKLSIAKPIKQYIMWYISTRNGGRYWHIRNEKPVSVELNNVLEELTASGKKFRVYYNEYEYSGYHGDVSLINDDTLDTIYVHHHISFGWDGDAYWRVCVIDEDYNEIEVFNSKMK